MRGQAGISDDLLYPAPQFAADLVQTLRNAFFLIGVNNREHGGQRPRLRTRGLRKQKDAIGVVDESA